MFRKLITRVAIVCGVLVCVATAGAGITAYLALSVPSFYAELREQGVSSESEQAELQQLASEFERWAAVSVARRRAEHTNLENNRCSDTHTIRLTQYQLNAELASGRSGAGDLREVRVQLLEDRIRLGAELFVQSSKMILTATLTPAIGEDGNLQLTIDRIGIGHLPLPHATLLKWLSEYADISTGKMRLDMSGTSPQLVVDIVGHGHNKVSIRSVQIEEGTLSIEFGAQNSSPSAADADRLAKR